MFFSPVVKPTAVHILVKRPFVSAEKAYDVECKSSGSKPGALITWWRGSQQITRNLRHVSGIQYNTAFGVKLFCRMQKKPCYDPIEISIEWHSMKWKIPVPLLHKLLISSCRSSHLPRAGCSASVRSALHFHLRQ